MRNKKLSYTSMRNLESHKNLVYYKNKHEGEDCVIMGSSPVLKDIPRGFLEKYKVIGVNATPTYYLPDYIVSVDLRFSWVPTIRRIARDNNIPYFITWFAPPSEETLKNHYALSDLKYFKNEIHFNAGVETKYELVKKHIIEKVNNPEILESRIFPFMGVIQDLAIPLAFYMGFKNVYLAGVEFPYKVNTSNARFYKTIDKIDFGETEYCGRRWSIEVMGETDKINRIFTLNKECTIKCFKYVNYQDLIK